MTDTAPTNKSSNPAIGTYTLIAGLVVAIVGVILYILYLNKNLQGAGAAILILCVVIVGAVCVLVSMFSQKKSEEQIAKGFIDRKKFGTIFMACGYLLALVGAFLTFLQGHLIFSFLYSPSNDSLKKIFDMPTFLLIIGFGIVLYGANQYLRTKHLGSDTDISGAAMRTFLLNNAILMALIFMIVVISCINPRFLQISVFVNILQQSSTKMIIALGICFTLLIAGTDLSAGRSVGLAAVLSASMMQTADYGNRFFPNLPQVNILLPIALAIVACMVFGYINGFLVSRFDMHPFIASLAVQVMIYGACSLFFDMPPNKSQPIGGLRTDFTSLGQYLIFNKIPVLIPIAIFFIILVWFLLNKTVFGKSVYAIGGNRQAAIVSGINVPLTIVGIFVFASLLYGVGGILEAARTAGATNNYGLGYELDAIAACVVGGVSLNGGVGKVRGIVVGVLIFTVIQYSLTFIGLNPYWQQIIKGVIIAVAVAMDMAKYRKR